MQQEKILQLSNDFREPLMVFIGIILFLLFSFFHQSQISFICIFIAIILGSYGLFIELVQSLLKKQYALDYIAALP